MKNIAIIFLLTGLLLAENNAVDFMETGLSARALAMGNAMTAGGRGLETVAHNPATLALKTKTYECSSAVVNNFSMVDRKALAFGYDKYGLTIGNSEITGIPKTSWGDDERPVENGSFSSSQYQYAVTYADGFGTDWLYGMTLKRYTWKIDTYTADGLGVDLGGLYRYPEPLFNANILLGASIRNVGRTQINWITGHKDTIPITLTAGGAVFAGFFERTMIVSSELVQQEYEPLHIRNGAEYWLAEQFLCVRGGTDMGRVTLGIGLQYLDVSLDYAQADYADLGLIKRISCRAEF